MTGTPASGTSVGPLGPLGSLGSLGPGQEFDRIREVLQGLPPAATVTVGPGDDAAVLLDGTVLSTDMAVEGVHFRLDWISAEEAGYRAAAAALSDLAAMAALPRGLLVSVALPGSGDLLAPLMAGVRAAASDAGAPLLGGDVARSPGPVVLDVTVVGHASHPLLRRGARVGDELWVTGTLGAAAAAVEAWQAGEAPAPEARHAFVRPVPRINEARWLVQAGALAGLDLSDGIAGDAGHLAAASGLTLTLDAEALRSVAHAGAPASADPLSRALHGGEDYELLVVLPEAFSPARVEEFRRTFDLPLTRVGQVGPRSGDPGHGVLLSRAPGAPPTPIRRGGWDHFASDAVPAEAAPAEAAPPRSPSPRSS